MNETIESGLNSGVAPEQSSVEQSQGIQNQPDERFKAAREQGYSKGYRKAQQEFAGQQQSPSHSGALDPEQIRQIASAAATEATKKQLEAENAQRTQEAQNQQAFQIWNNLSSSAQEARKNYADFDQVVGSDYAKFGDAPDIVTLAAGVQNSAEVLYELAKNPEKIAVLRTLPAAFKFAKMQEIAQSIVKNKEALEAPLPNAPLSHVSPSYSQGVSGGKGASIDDFAKMFGG